MEEHTCVICLDGPFEENPLLLLACGCKNAWFHRICQMQWMEHTHYPLLCPTCKRTLPMKLHYAYHHSFGEAQQKLRCICYLGMAETILAISLWIQYKQRIGYDLPETLLMPIQSLLLLNMPHIIHSEYDLLTAIKYVMCKNGIQVFYLALCHFRRSWFHILNIPNHVSILVCIGFLHCVAFGAKILESRFGRRVPPIDPRTPFLVGFDTIYADSLHAIEASANTSKSLRRSPRLAGGQ